MTALSRTINAKKKLSRSKSSTRLYSPWIKTIQNGSRLIATCFSATTIRSRLKSRRQSKATRMVTSPFHYRCWCWSSQDNKLLPEKYKADMNQILIKYHATPLFNAAVQGHVEVVRYLLESHNADIHLGTAAVPMDRQPCTTQA